MHYLSSLLPSIDQTIYMIILTKEVSIKNLNFMTPGAGVLVLGRGHINHTVYVEYALVFTLSKFRILISIVLKIFNASVCSYFLAGFSTKNFGAGRAGERAVSTIRLKFWLKFCFLTISQMFLNGID